MVLILFSSSLVFTQEPQKKALIVTPWVWSSIFIYQRILNLSSKKRNLKSLLTTIGEWHWNKNLGVLVLLSNHLLIFLIFMIHLFNISWNWIHIWQVLVVLLKFLIAYIMHTPYTSHKNLKFLRANMSF